MLTNWPEVLLCIDTFFELEGVDAERDSDTLFNSRGHVEPICTNFTDQTVMLHLNCLYSENASVDDSSIRPLYSSNPGFYPVASRSEALDKFQELVERDLVELHNKVSVTRGYSNLDRSEKIAMKELEANPYIVVRNSDKGGNITVLDSGLYKTLNNDILADRNTYCKLKGDPTRAFQDALKKVLKEGVELGAIDKKLEESLFVTSPVIPVFHSLPKLHKGLFPPPLRPIVAGIGSLVERLGEWVDHHLQPLTTITPTFLQDTKHTINILSKIKWESSYSWVTCDVIGLYPSIPRDKGLEALSIHLDRFSNYSPGLKEFLVIATDFLLQHNFFMFDNEFFLQTRGASMGAKNSPSFPNIYMFHWEQMYVFNADNPFKEDIKWIGRFIDDLLIIWESTENRFQNFIKYITNNNLNLGFTYHFGGTEVNFLDIRVSGNAQVIDIFPYRKETATNSVLMATSCHPKHVLNNIPFGEMCRIKRNCTNPIALHTATEELTCRFKNRGYSEAVLKTARVKVDAIDREDLLRYSRRQINQPTDPPTLQINASSSADSVIMTNKEKIKRGKANIKRNKKLFLVTPYSVQFNKIRQIILKYIPILETDNILREIVAGGISTVSKRGPKIGSTISPSLFQSTPTLNRTWLHEAGNWRCGHNRYLTCGYMQVSKEVTSCHTGATHKIKDYINCNSKYVVYVATCLACCVQYVGCTSNSLKTRFRKHVSDIDNNSVGVSMLTRHFRDNHAGDPKHLRVAGMEKVRLGPRGGDLTRKLYNRETYWMFLLETRQPKGLNKRLDLVVTCS
ncbi:uncharacterized protein LOC130284250 [Hyla sarda]|uniref:uncharacterized protein LOC130284250 n=1 Tax=Hyla sarda TaxID=327740 RepID=UPI0024C3EC8A|nr:uncharacterized protein LOC130284250 [Hyla sarda]